MTVQRFAKEHPWWTALGVLFVLGLIVQYWYVIFPAAAVLAFALHKGKQRYDHNARAAALIERANNPAWGAGWAPLYPGAGDPGTDSHLGRGDRHPLQ